jgi:hypothetical protein
MANADYARDDARKPGAAAARLPGAAEAAAAAAAAPPRPLGLPRVLVELPQDAASSLDQVGAGQAVAAEADTFELFSQCN